MRAPSLPSSLLLASGITLLVSSLAAVAHAADAPVTVFENNCAPCHGLDGKAKTPAGKKLGAHDLTASKFSDADIEKQIREGSKDKAGKEKMPPFKDKLSPADITALVAYVKTFRHQTRLLGPSSPRLAPPLLDFSSSRLLDSHSMKATRRNFLKTSLTASAAVALGSQAKAAAAAGSRSGREYYELRAYRLKPGASSELLDSYLQQALIPALNKRGIKNVGVFTELDVNSKANPPTATPKADSPVWVFIAYPDIETFSSVASTINLDPEVQQAGKAYLETPKATPAYDRIDSWLLLAFAGMPKMEVPDFSKEKVPTRMFEFRTYESHSEAKALNKIAMFHAGEIELMKRLGMSPVFYGQAIAGSGLPHLSYFTGGRDVVAHFANWKKFGPAPEWQKLRTDPQYADNTSKTGPSRFLTPKSYSQL